MTVFLLLIIQLAATACLAAANRALYTVNVSVGTLGPGAIMIIPHVALLIKRK